MGPHLRREIDRQLLADLAHYGVTESDLRIDWSDALQEGHCAKYLDGTLESLSDLRVRRPDGMAVADGWLDFVHDDGTPPVVFWLFLSVSDGSGWRKVKAGAEIPEHVWAALSDELKSSCARDHCKWTRDEKVKAWMRGHGI